MGAAASQVGPEAVALATVLNKELGLSQGKTVAVLQKGFGLTLTPGGLSQALDRIAARCEPTYENLKQYVRASASVTMDETGWRIGGLSAWLHVATTAEVTVYGIFRGRGFDEAAALIGADYDGFLVRDGWGPYRRFEFAYHQSCNRHLINRCDEMILLATPAGAAFPLQVKGILQKGLLLRDRYTEGIISDHGLLVATGRLEAKLERLLERSYRLPENCRLAKHLSREFDFLFTYLGALGWTLRTIEANRHFAPQWSRARSGAATALKMARTLRKS